MQVGGKGFTEWQWVPCILWGVLHAGWTRAHAEIIIYTPPEKTSATSQNNSTNWDQALKYDA